MARGFSLALQWPLLELMQQTAIHIYFFQQYVD